jgi:uncharacterized membrane protein
VAVIRYYRLIRLFLLVSFVLGIFLAFFFIWVTIPLAAIMLLYFGFGLVETRTHLPHAVGREREERRRRLEKEAEARRKLLEEERRQGDFYGRA